MAVVVMKSTRSESKRVTPRVSTKTMGVVAAPRRRGATSSVTRAPAHHTPTVLVVEDQPLMRMALGFAIRRRSPQAVVFEVDRLAELKRQYVDGFSPDLVCLDLRLPDATGMMALREVRKLYPDLPVIVFSANSAADVAHMAIELGASAYIEKSAYSSELENELGRYLTADPAPAGDRPVLTERQIELLSMLNSGMSNRTVSEALGISENTVKVHLWRLYKRLNVGSRAQATRMARSLGMLI